jgi:hypothetical protein
MCIGFVSSYVPWADATSNWVQKVIWICSDQLDDSPLLLGAFAMWLCLRWGSECWWLHIFCSMLGKLLLYELALWQEVSCLFPWRISFLCWRSGVVQVTFYIVNLVWGLFFNVLKYLLPCVIANLSWTEVSCGISRESQWPCLKVYGTAFL